MKRNLLIIAALGLSCLPSLAFAQFSSTAGQDTELLADDIVSVRGIITLTGQADIRQGDTRILADKVKIYSANRNSTGPSVSASTSDIDRVVADGNFYYITPTQEVRGERGIYRQATNDFTVTGDVILLQDDSIVTGDKLIYNLETEQAKVISDCKGRKCGQKKRVRVLIKNAGNSTPSAS